ncbi:MAG: DNA polymerase I [bacterium]
MYRVKKNALFLIDGSYLLYRSYYGLRPMQTSQGLAVQAVYGFCRTIKKLIDMFDMQNVVLVWDSKGKTFRSEIYENYKATRQAPPNDLFIQKEYIQEFAKLINLKQIAKNSYEADDLIGSLAQDYKGEQVVIVGPDKDLYQLLSDKVIIYDPFKEIIIDQHSFAKEKGFPANKVPFFFAMLGDTSDNIPGVAGIGKKTATELVQKFDSLEDLYKNLDKIEKERTKSLLLENKDNGFLSLKLFLLKHYALNFTKKDFEFDKKNLINAAPLFEKLEFKSLLKNLNGEFSAKEVAKKINKNVQENPNGGRQLSLFEPQKEIPPKGITKGNVQWKCHLVTSPTELENLINNLKKSKEIAIDTETTGLRPLSDSLVGISFAFNKEEGFYIPFAHKDETPQLNRQETLEKLKPIFLNSKIKKIFHNAKFDLLVIKQYGFDVKNITFDTLIAANLLRKDDDEKINLKVLSVRYLNEPMHTFQQILKGKYKDFSQVPIASAAEYAAYDSLQTFKLKPILEKELKKIPELNKIFNKLEMPLSQILFKMEFTGIKLNPEKLEEIGAEIEKQLKTIEKKIFTTIENNYAKKWLSMNLNSPQQVQAFLFDELKLPEVRKTIKGQRGTGQEVLEELSKIHPIPGMILKYRELSKLKNTYINPLINEINPKIGRIHTSFSQTMVATGRLSSSNPNLQNIPATTDHGIRSAFEADKGNIFLSADYSQVELRVLAHMTKDKNLITAFKNDIDIHTQTASQIFNVPITDVTKEQRQIGKRINFSIIYGLTPYGLSKDLDIKQSQAKEYIEKYFNTYPQVASWIEETAVKAEKDGFTQTLMGRRRYVPGLKEKNHSLYQAAKRIAINSPVQGTSAELIKIAMLKINDTLEKKNLKAKIILQIHDELLLELPKEESEIIEKIIKKEMENVVKWTVPFKISIHTGKNWEQVTK